MITHHISKATSTGTEATACGKDSDYVTTTVSLVDCWDCLEQLNRTNPRPVKQVMKDTVVPVEHDRKHSVGVGGFPHDCEACIYLDTVEGERTHDLYYCPGFQGRPTIVARYGFEGPDYFSGLAFATKEPLIALGLVLSLKRGLIQYEDALKQF